MTASRSSLRRAVRRFGLAVGAGLALAGAATPASADLIRYRYGGTITAADPASGVAVGTPFSGTFAYDPTGPRDSGSNIAHVPEEEVYSLARATTGADLTASVGGRSVLGPIDGLVIRVAGPDAFVAPDNPPAFVSIAAGPSDAATTARLTFSNADHAILPLYALPKSFGLADFTAARFAIDGPDGRPLYEGAITSLAPEPTPEPSTLVILATAGGGALVRSRLRRRRVS